MRLVTMIALVFPLAQIIAAAQIVAGESGLELRYELIDSKNPGWEERTTEVHVHVEIVNRGAKNVVIPTKGVGPLTFWNGQTAFILFQPLVPTKTRDGFRIVTPMADLAPVELRPNEAAVLHCDLKINKNTIIGGVDYELSPTFAERYGFWSGKLSARARTTTEAEQTDERAPE
jgi:hypothetical protein